MAAPPSPVEDLAAEFSPWLKRWQLTPDGAPFSTRGSYLMPVRHAGQPAMLKVALDAEEQNGARLMHWWEGDGAARVLAHADNVLLMERATGEGSLFDMALDGRDDEASRILCATVARLHAPRERPPPELLPLEQWFIALWPAAAIHGGILTRCQRAAEALLASPREQVPLHADIHHCNVLDFGPRGWLAIDPKWVIGERGFDYANILCNPDLPIVTQPARLRRQVEVVSEAAGLERRRLLQWVLAYAGLSAAWFMEDDDPLAESDLQVARHAATLLDAA
ncbi:MAG: aminoglycoside phosphotransferase family protein [Moraxellaceae bacterium]|nr:aminoglycoside phosphotransferase family protein [Moraxellaceae bacterium]